MSPKIRPCPRPRSRFRIGELARRVGATPRTVRYYEELGLLPARGRPRGLAPPLRRARTRRAWPSCIRVRDLLGLSLAELRDWMDAEAARAALRERWHGCRRRRRRPRPHPGRGDAARRDPGRARALPPPGARAARGRAAGQAPPPDPRAARRVRGAAVNPQAAAVAALQVDRALEHDARHPDGDDQLVDRPDRAARHLPRHPPEPARRRATRATCCG